MAFEYMAMLLDDHLHNYLRSQERIILRQMEDPFDLSDHEFMLLYRLNKNAVYRVVDAIEHRLNSQRVTGISPEKMLIFIFLFGRKFNSIPPGFIVNSFFCNWLFSKTCRRAMGNLFKPSIH